MQCKGGKFIWGRKERLKKYTFGRLKFDRFDGRSLSLTVVGIFIHLQLLDPIKAHWLMLLLWLGCFFHSQFPVK